MHTLASTGHSSLSPNGLRSQLAAICSQARDASQALGQPTSSADLAPWTERTLAIVSALVNKEAALQPSSQAAAYRVYIAGLQSSLVQLRQILAAVKAGDKAEMTKIFDHPTTAEVKGDKVASANGWGCSLAAQASSSQTADSAAAELAHTAQVAIETLATDHHGSYASANGKPAVLQAYEATIPTVSGRGDAYLSAVHATATSYTVTTTSTTGDTFSISRTSTGALTRTCTAPHVTGGSCVNGSW